MFEKSLSNYKQYTSIDDIITREKQIQYIDVILKPGSILVFHDSMKAFPLLKIVLPELLDYCNQQGLKPISL